MNLPPQREHHRVSSSCQLSIAIAAVSPSIIANAASPNPSLQNTVLVLAFFLVQKQPCSVASHLHQAVGFGVLLIAKGCNCRGNQGWNESVLSSWTCIRALCIASHMLQNSCRIFARPGHSPGPTVRATRFVRPAQQNRRLGDPVPQTSPKPTEARPGACLFSLSLSELSRGRGSNEKKALNLETSC